MAAEQHRFRPAAAAAAWVMVAYVVVVALWIGPGGSEAADLRLEFGRSINLRVQARITNLLRPFLLTPVSSQGNTNKLSLYLLLQLLLLSIIPYLCYIMYRSAKLRFSTRPLLLVGPHSTCGWVDRPGDGFGATSSPLLRQHVNYSRSHSGS